MAILTRKDIYRKMVEEDKPECPHCGEKMSIWECPPVNFSDGLGWGTPYLYVCFNNSCPLFVSGWDNIMDNFQVNASYRCIMDPMSTNKNCDCMPVFSSEGGRGSIIDEEVEAKEKEFEKATKNGLKLLDSKAEAKDVDAILKVLFDDNTLTPVALRAAELIGELGGLDVIEPVRNREFKKKSVRNTIEASIKAIHSRNYTKECPFCAEIIKARAIVCKECGKDLN